MLLLWFLFWSHREPLTLSLTLLPPSPQKNRALSPFSSCLLLVLFQYLFSHQTFSYFFPHVISLHTSNLPILFHLSNLFCLFKMTENISIYGLKHDFFHQSWQKHLPSLSVPSTVLTIYYVAPKYFWINEWKAAASQKEIAYKMWRMNHGCMSVCWDNNITSKLHWTLYFAGNTLLLLPEIPHRAPRGSPIPHPDHFLPGF